MRDLLRKFLHRLERHYSVTRILSWPREPGLRIAVLVASADSAQLDQCLDALETFHPGSEVTLVSEAALPDDLPRRYPGFKSIAVMLAGRADVPPRPDLALLLHPWPAAALPADAARCWRRQFARLGARRRWILFKNQELWDGRPTARLARRLFNVVRPALLSAVERADRAVLQHHVTPYLAQAARWSGELPCPHERALTVFRIPRWENFCPTCGAGFTPEAHAPSHECLMGLYGAGYALSSRYLGRRAFQDYSEGCVRQVNGYLETLGFDDTRLPPATRRLLDYGCGNGRYSLLWRRRGWRYLGLDPSADNIAFAREVFAAAEPPEVEFAHGGLDHPQVRAGAPFGMVFLSHVLEHVPHPQDLLAALRLQVTAGGWLYVEVPNALRYTWDPAHRGYLSAEHLWDFTPRYLESLARAAGWRDVRLLEVGDPNCPYLALLARNLD